MMEPVYKLQEAMMDSVSTCDVHLMYSAYITYAAEYEALQLVLFILCIWVIFSVFLIDMCCWYR